MHKPSFKTILNNVTSPGKSLTQRVVVSGFWVFTLRILQRAFGFIRLIVLARILFPNDFGLMGIALLTMSTLETFSQTGFQQALIQKKENIYSYLNSAWTFLILRGFILFGILYLIAPYAATFFNATEAKSIIRIIGISILIQAFTNIGVIYFKKELEFNKQFIYELAGTLADFIVSVSAALILRNVWALVFGLLAGDFAMCCLSYFLHPHRPRLNFDLGKLKELWGFGRWISGSNIFTFLIMQGDDIFVGKILGATPLGFYQMAYRISNLPATEITHVISQITFPAYSKLQESLPRLKEAYLKVFQLIVFLAFPAAGLIFVLASDFTKIFLGEKWMPMVPAMQVLCIFGVTRALNATTGSIFQAVGRPSIIAKVSFIQLIFLAAIIYPLVKMSNLVGVAWAVTLANLLCFVLAFREVLQIINESKTKIARAVFPSLLATVITICVIYLFRALTVGRVSIFITFFLSILIGFGMYSIYAKVSGFSFSSFMNSGSLFKKSVEIKTWEK
ncbi:MAG: lipopolysaccharide biosynthesis protein [Thermodesulfobacteriota bacterium]